MKTNIKNLLLPIISALIIFIFSAAYVFGGQKDYSESERRLLSKFPEISLSSVSDGKFMDDFESYSLDQFPARDTMRSIKALTEFFIFGNTECNGFYVEDGHLVKIEYPQDDSMLDYAAAKFKRLCEMYFKDKNCNIYFSLVPDKGAFLAEKAGVLSFDYDNFADNMIQRLPDMNYIDIFPYLSADDYYTTDPHWRQEKITDVANALSEAMGNPLSDSYETVKLDVPFYGAYYGQAALPKQPDDICYLTNDTIKGCTVKKLDDKTGEFVYSEMYNMENANGRDPYEMFLSGSQPIMVIENSNADTEKELVLFRDSYGSSLAPLLAESYKKITLIDIRYIDSNFLGAFVDFNETDDVLFMYSTLILNSSTSMR